MKTVALILGMFLSGLALTSLIGINSAGYAQKNYEPTRIQVGVMTEKQRVHSRLFERYSAGRKLDVPPPERRLGRNTVETAEETVYLEPGITVSSPDVPIPTFIDFLKELSCNADAIVIGSARGRTSQLTENKEFLFSDYVVTSEEVFKNNSAAYIAPSSDIAVTRPGGRVQIKGRTISAVDGSFKPLDMGERYLLFLKYLPETGAYKSIRKGSFLIHDDDLIALTEEGIPGGPGDSRAFTSEARSVLTSDCDKNK
jgi:hypothetical protein